jgi:hypothetical protein
LLRDQLVLGVKEELLLLEEIRLFLRDILGLLGKQKIVLKGETAYEMR